MGIYTFITAVLLPILINIVLNICIFIHVRNSSRRIQPLTVGTLISGVNNQQLRISRRDISLLKQMILIFTMFILGWIPIASVHIADIVEPVDSVITAAVTLLSEICLLSLVINLFLCNHEIRQFLFNTIRRWFQH
jgi:hypothetical protein